MNSEHTPPATEPPARSAPPDTTVTAGLTPPVTLPASSRRPYVPWSQPVNPTQTSRAPRPATVAVIVAILVGAICWRPFEFGIGYTITGLVALAAILGTAPADYLSRNRRYRWVLVVALVGLLLVPTFRAADWVVALSLLVATGVGLALFAEAHSLRGLFVAAFTPWWTWVPGIAWLVRRPDRTDAATTRPAGEAGADRSRRPSAQTVWLGVAVGAVTVLLLLVFGALLAGASPSFGSLFDFDADLSMNVQIGPALGAGLLVALAVTGCVYLVHTGTRYPERPSPRRAPTWAWAIPVGALLAMFILFLGVQAGTLFRGDDFVRDPDGPSYSEYAVSGFWQLLTVTILVIVVMCVAWRLVDLHRAGTDRAPARLTMRILLGGLGIATLGIAASALHRMTLYVGAYGATADRVFGLFVESYLIVVLLMMLTVGVRLEARWLTRGVIIASAFAMLLFALINPDRLIASINVDHHRDAGRLDFFHMAGLSPDALPAILALPDHERGCVLSLTRDRYDEGWQGWDLPTHRLEHDDQLRAVGGTTQPCPEGPSYR